MKRGRPRETVLSLLLLVMVVICVVLIWHIVNLQKDLAMYQQRYLNDQKLLESTRAMMFKYQGLYSESENYTYYLREYPVGHWYYNLD